VDPRERWQTLQSHLSAARGALASRDKRAALEHIEAALRIDPEFLAARMLLDRVTSAAEDVSFISSVADQINVSQTPASASEPAAPAPPVTVSPETLASFEERVLRRVREREAAVSRVASTRGRKWAFAVPLATAAGFLAAMSSTTLYEATVLPSRSIAMSASLVRLDAPAPLVAPDAPTPLVARAVEEPPTSTVAPTRHVDVAPAVRAPARPAQTAIAMTGIVDVPPEPVRVPPPPAPSPASAPLPQSQPAAQPATPSAARGVQALPPRPASDVAASSPAPTPAPAVVPVALVSTADERALVDQTLQRYRRAYNRLDARSAQAVYPAVNEHALARAFEDLESQVLLFESCVIDVQGRSANVTCRGSSHYVPKIGNHETRVERRVWNFTLRKDDGDWKIENARAAR
jgi:hypothetical protein